MVLCSRFAMFGSFYVLGLGFHLARGAEIEFSSDGQLSQLKHTIAATHRGATTVGACVGSCVALASWSGNDPSVWTDGASSGNSVEGALTHLAYPTPRIWLLGEQQALGGAGLAGDAQVFEVADVVTFPTSGPLTCIGNNWELCWCDEWYGLTVPPRQY